MNWMGYWSISSNRQQLSLYWGTLRAKKWQKTGLIFTPHFVSIFYFHIH
jgi:hypothetical protein